MLPSCFRVHKICNCKHTLCLFVRSRPCCFVCNSSVVLLLILSQILGVVGGCEHVCSICQFLGTKKGVDYVGYMYQTRIMCVRTVVYTDTSYCSVTPLLFINKKNLMARKEARRDVCISAPICVCRFLQGGASGVARLNARRHVSVAGMLSRLFTCECAIFIHNKYFCPVVQPALSLEKQSEGSCGYNIGSPVLLQEEREHNRQL